MKHPIFDREKQNLIATFTTEKRIITTILLIDNLY